jgi:3',5'-cyclic AMP phosphodiesterase CpdA
MRKIVHISDLHFGRADPTLVSALISRIHQLQPDIVVVSGDLTQRARPREFKAARIFLDAVTPAKLIVPGNHDIPLENLVDRFLFPFRLYRKYIGQDLNPVHTDDEIAIMGVNTARGFRRAEGKISDRQIDEARRFFCSVDRRLIKIVVTHHPFDSPATHSVKKLVRNAERAIVTLGECQADLYLAGTATRHWQRTVRIAIVSRIIQR